jgi:hypothetical protein
MPSRVVQVGRGAVSLRRAGHVWPPGTASAHRVTSIATRAKPAHETSATLPGSRGPADPWSPPSPGTVPAATGSRAQGGVNSGTGVGVLAGRAGRADSTSDSQRADGQKCTTPGTGHSSEPAAALPPGEPQDPARPPPANQALGQDRCGAVADVATRRVQSVGCIG